MKTNDPAIAELVVSVFYGGLHAVGLMMAVATVALSLAMRQGVYGKNIAYLGIAIGLFDVIGAYPDHVGPVLVLVSVPHGR